MANANKPRWSHLLALNLSDPNDPYVVPRWTDWTDLVRSIGQLQRGQVYDLGRSIPSQPTYGIRDINEYLNPDNPSSPYYGSILPYRAICSTGVWPNDGAGNLLNSNGWRGNNVAAYDPTFESYANGAAAPNWLSQINRAYVANVTATVTTASAFQGTKSLTWATAADNNSQGQQWQALCQVGRQYTASVYVRQSAANTTRFTVADQTLGYDAFGRTVASGWGTADNGGAWTTSGGSASDYSVGSGSAVQQHNAVNTRHICTLGSGIHDSDVYVTFTIPVTPTGAPIQAGIVSRYVDSSNFYFAGVQVDTTGLYNVFMAKRVAGVNTGIGASIYTLGAPSAGTPIRLRLITSGNNLKLKAWPAGSAEPSQFIMTTELTPDTALPAAGPVGVESILTTGNTNPTPVSITFDDFQVVGSTGATTTATGAYNRLTCTFTATQPLHYLGVDCVGSTAADTINIDAIQLEEGAAATAFTSTGAVVYPLHRGYAERFTRSWASKGFEGQVSLPGVDSLAVLNAMAVPHEYTYAMMTTNAEYRAALPPSGPTFYYPLTGSAGSALAPDESANVNPPLIIGYPASLGSGTLPSFGQGLEIAGYAGMTGVTFTPGANPAVAGSSAMSILGVGPRVGTPAVSFPGVLSTPSLTAWGASVAAWVKCTPTSPAAGVYVAHALKESGSGTNYTSPVALIIQAAGTATAALQSIGGSGSPQVAATSSTTVTDGLPHLLVATISQSSGGNSVAKIYIDGVLAATATVATSVCGMLNVDATDLQVGGFIAVAQPGLVINGTVSQTGFWDKELTAAEITNLYTIGSTAYAGEISGTRVERHFTMASFNGARRVSTGTTAMQAPSWTGFYVDGLTDLQDTTLAEGGANWAAPDGAVVFEGRQDRWLRLTPSWTFGEDTAAGEIPYLDPGPVFDFDPTYVYANVQVARANGSTAQGGLLADIATARRRFFGRSYSQTSDFDSDTTAQYAADWIFYTHSFPLSRVAAIAIDPASNTSLWHAALSIEVGQLVRVKKRAKAANAGAGLTISQDFWVAQIAHQGINFDKGTWNTVLWLTPVGSEAQGVAMRPWILEDSTWGVLDHTTRLAW